MDKNYIVTENDTIDDIALKFNTTPMILKLLNGDNFKIKAGKEIKVPSMNSDLFDYYVINNGDTLYKIAINNNINPSLLAELNGLNVDDYIYPNQVLLVPKAGSILYITAIGDTFNEILKGLNVSSDELISQNSNIYLQPEQLIVYKPNK